jgi:energy-coupling factor transport system ATP-binding protein
MQVEVKNLSFSYAKKSKLAVHALKDINLTISEGDFFGIIGKTGSGKSTFVQHLNGLIKIQKNSGEIRIGEFELSGKCDFKKLRSKVGMVFQYPEYQLFAETVLEDVAFGLKNFFPDMPQEEVESRVKSALYTMGLDYEEVKNKSPFELSGGQKRRVAIAGVIVTRPEVLVLDEPIAGLDPKGKREFVSILKKLHEDFVKTIIIVSHDMDFVAENCNKVAVFNSGKIVKQGLAEEVFFDRATLEACGLETPLVAYLISGLKEKGIELENKVTVQGFCSEIEKFVGGKV